MSWFSELDTREKVLIFGGGALVVIFFIRGVKGKSSASTASVSTAATDQAQQTSDLVSQINQQQTASQSSLMDALSQMNGNITQAITAQQQQSSQMFQQSEQDMIKAITQGQKDQMDALGGLLSQMKQSQAVQQAPVYQVPAPTTAPSTVVPQSSGGTISSPFVTHSFEVSKGDHWSQSGNTVTVHDSLGGTGTYNTQTHNSSWDYSHENIPSLSASQVAQAKANAIAGRPLF